MRPVYILTDHLAAGGIGVVVEKHAKWLTLAGYEVHLICNVEGAVPSAEWGVLSPGIMERFRMWGVSVIPADHHSLARVLDHIEEGAATIVHASWRGRAFARTHLFHARRLKPTYFMHSSCEYKDIKMANELLVNLCGAPSVLTASEIVSNDIRTVSGEVKIHRLSYGVDTDVFVPPDVTDLEAKPRRVLFIGRPNKVKGGHLIPQLARHLALHGIQIWVHGVFRKGDYSYEDVPNVHRTDGAISEVQMVKLMQTSVAVLVPSTRGEGQPLVVLEAISCGTIVIGTKDSVGGLWPGHPVIIAPAEASALSETIVSILEDPFEAQRRIETGLRQIGDFTWERHVKEFAHRIGL